MCIWISIEKLSIEETIQTVDYFLIRSCSFTFVIFAWLTGIIRNARDLYDYAEKELTKEPTCTEHRPRTFLWVEVERPKRHIQDSLRTLQGTQQLHDIRGGEECVIYKARSCFCEGCLSQGTCAQEEYTGKPKAFVLTKKMKSVDKLSRSETPISAPARAPVRKRRVMADPHLYVDGPMDRVQADKIAEQLINAPFPLKQNICSTIHLQDIVPCDRSVVSLGGTVDQRANSILINHCEVPGVTMYPLLIEADGNCLPRCGSIAAYGSQDYHHDIRIRIALELVHNHAMYLNDDHLAKGIEALPKPSAEFYLRQGGYAELEHELLYYFNQEINDTLKSNESMGIFQMFALATILHQPIYSIYPSIGSLPVHTYMNRLILPAETMSTLTPCFIMWSSTRDDIPDEYWAANHFVNCVPLSTTSETVVAVDGRLQTSSYGSYCFQSIKSIYILLRMMWSVVSPFYLNHQWMTETL